MKGSKTETFKPNLLSQEYRAQFKQQAGGKGFVKALVTDGPKGEACAYQPASLGAPLVNPTPLGRAGQ